MQRLIFPIKQNGREKVTRVLSERFGLPNINSNLALYCKRHDFVFEIDFLNNECTFRTHSKDPEPRFRYLLQFHSTPPIKVENRNIRFFLKTLHQFGFNDAYISEIVKLDFCANNGNASIQFDTLIGDLLVISEGTYNEVKHVTEVYLHAPIDSSQIDDLIEIKGNTSEQIFSDMGILNSKIQNFADRFSINMSSSTSTLGAKLASKSNDYTFYNTYTSLLADIKLEQQESVVSHEASFKPLSIIIPTFNSDRSIVPVLQSIQSQDLTEENKRQLDVVIVDDGSKISTAELISPYISQLSFKPRIIRLEQNEGRSVARNVGFKASKYEHVVFVDSDILLSKNYLLEHSVRLQMIPLGIFMSLKENISPDSEFTTAEFIQHGLPVSNRFSDKRLIRDASNDGRWTGKESQQGIFELLNETDMFKKYGYGRLINKCHDLPSCVVGHNMSMNRKAVEDAGEFSTAFSGWGMEDTYFGASAIASGYFVIPVISTSVYHINHPSRSQSDKMQMEEYRRNESIYNKLMSEEL